MNDKKWEIVSLLQKIIIISKIAHSSFYSIGDGDWTHIVGTTEIKIILLKL